MMSYRVSSILNKLSKYWYPRKAASTNVVGSEGGLGDQKDSGRSPGQEAASEQAAAADIQIQLPLKQQADHGDKSRGEEGDGDGDGEGRAWGKSLWFPRKGIGKLAKVSLAVTARTTVSLLLYPSKSSPESAAAAKVLLYLAVGSDISAYIFCLTAILLCHRKPIAAGITGLVWSAAAALGIFY